MWHEQVEIDHVVLEQVGRGRVQHVGLGLRLIQLIHVEFTLLLLIEVVGVQLKLLELLLLLVERLEFEADYLTDGLVLGLVVLQQRDERAVH